MSTKELGIPRTVARLGWATLLGSMVILALITLVGLFALTATAHGESAAAPAATASPQPGAAFMAGMSNLVSGLLATPGCLGVETAQTSSRKLVIFAWFKDKESVLKWYNSDVHRQAQDRFFPNRPPHKPLEYVPDDVGPVMAIASLTPTDSARFAQTKMPISQIAIELYTPLPGGISLGGRFAPDSLAVPHLRIIPVGPASTGPGPTPKGAPR